MAIAKSGDIQVLVTSDDGADAPGLELLARAAEYCGARVRVVATANDRSLSGRSHSGRGAPTKVISCFGRQMTIRDATPARIVMMEILGEAPDIVLSGVNDGFNIGQDISVSATVAAALEAATLGVPSLALSSERIEDLEAREDELSELLTGLMPISLSTPGSFGNVNIPAGADLADRKRTSVSKLTAFPAVLRPGAINQDFSMEDISISFSPPTRSDCEPNSDIVICCFERQVSVSWCGFNPEGGGLS